jgi:octaprenyl-diphosphate synthase
MKLDNLLSLIERDLEAVEEAIKSNLENDIKLITTIGTHILDSGGKRLRPALLLLTSRLLHNLTPERISIATAIEFIHTATLLHDDVVDNSELRRGKSSANTIWGNEASVLVGDFLFAKAFSLMVKCNNLAILEIMSNATKELAEGEIFELIKTGDLQTAINDYFKIIDKKTAILFAAACEVSAVMAGIDTKHQKLLKEFGSNIGISFQLVDDALDYMSTDEELGKKIGIDIEEGKVTYPLIFALEKATEEEFEKIKELFYKESPSKEDVFFIKDFVIKKGGTDAAVKAAKVNVEKAKQALSSFEENEAKEALIKLSDFIVSRRF